MKLYLIRSDSIISKMKNYILKGGWEKKTPNLCDYSASFHRSVNEKNQPVGGHNSLSFSINFPIHVLLTIAYFQVAKKLMTLKGVGGEGFWKNGIIRLLWNWIRIRPVSDHSRISQTDQSSGYQLHVLVSGWLESRLIPLSIFVFESTNERSTRNHSLVSHWLGWYHPIGTFSFHQYKPCALRGRLVAIKITVSQVNSLSCTRAWRWCCYYRYYSYDCLLQSNEDYSILQDLWDKKIPPGWPSWIDSFSSLKLRSKSRILAVFGLLCTTL